MPRGELVGEAFIRITSDTTAARRAIHREAREMGDDFSSEFGKEVEASIEARMAGARKKLANSLANVDFSDFEKRFGSVGAAVNKLEEAFEDLRKEGTITNKEFELFTKTLHTWASDASIQERAAKDADALRKLSVEVTKAHTEANRLNKVFDAEDFDFALRDAAVAAERFNRSLRDSNTIQFGDKFSEAQVSLEKLRQGLRGADALIFKAARSSDDLDGGLRRSSRSGGGLMSVFGSINKSLEGMAHRGNPLVDLFVAPLRAGAALGKLVEGTLLKAFARLGFAGRAAIGPQFLAVLGGMAAAMAAAAKAASLFASALSLVAGMATIAASAIGGALVGALLLAAGAIPAAVAGLGGFILFFKDFEARAPKSLELLKRFGTSFRTAFDKEAFRGIDTTITKIVRALEPLAGPLATSLGKAINHIVNTLANGLSDPRIQQSIRGITQAIPRQVQLLGDTLINLGLGLVGFFKPIMPFVTTMLEAVNRIATSFRNWANSVSGQAQITHFMELVTPMAESLARTLGNVATAIGGIFRAAAEGGTAQKFLDFLEEVTGKFSDFVNSTEGQNKLKGWFDDAFRAGQALGELIAGVARIFGALDTSKSRDQVIKLTDGIGNFLTRTAPKLESFLGFIDGIGDSLGKLNFQPFIDLVSFIGGGMKDFFDAVKGDAFDALNAKLDGFNTLGDTIKNDLLPALSDLKPLLQPILDFFGSAAFKNAADGFKGVSDVINGAVTALSGLLNVLTGVATLDGEKIKQGFEQIFKGAGEAAVGAFNVAFASGGTKGILDKVLGTDSLNFDETKKNIDGFFAGINESTSNFDNTIGDTISQFFGDLGQKFTDARLAIGGFFSGLFGGEEGGGFPAIDFTALNDSINNFFLGIGDTISTWFTNTRLAIGQFFSSWATDIAASFPVILETLGAFFSDLPNKIAYWLGAATGSIAAYFYNQWNAVFAQFETVVIPWIVALPGRIEDTLDAAALSVANWFTNQWNAVFAYFETVAIPWIQAVPGRIEDTLDAAALSVANWFTTQWNAVYAYFETVAIPWVVGIPGRVEDALDNAANAVAEWFIGMWNGVYSYFENTVVPWFRNLPENATKTLSSNATFLVGWFTTAFANLKVWVESTFLPYMKSLPGRAVVGFTELGVRIGVGIANHMKGVINGLITQINNFIAGYNSWNGPLPDIGYMRYLAKGGLIDEPTMAMMGEGGKRELVVPLDRPLSQIDASVRGLAAIAQGRGTVSTGPMEGSKTIAIADGAIRIVTPYSDPVIVAEQVMDRMVEEVFG